MKKLRVYRQHTVETCGISCLMMALDYFGVEYPTVSKEAVYYRTYGAKATAGTLGAAIAYALSLRGLEVTLVHASEQLLENRGDYFPPALHQALLEEHKAYIEKGSFTVKAGVNVTCQTLREELMRQKLVIVQCLMEGDADGMHDHVMHWILLYGLREDRFLACDPLCGKLALTEETLSAYLDTPFGSSYIAVGSANS